MAVDPSQLPSSTTTPSGSLSGYEGQLQSQQIAGSPLALPTPTDAQMSNLEFNAQQLYATSIANTGQLPNPQFAAESLATGSTPDNVSAYGDPTAAPYLTAGATGFGNQPTSMLGPSTGAPNVYNFDPGQYKAATPGLIQQNQQFAPLGEVPIANVGYFNSIVNGNRSEVQNWQSWLSHTGYLSNHPTNGYMDQTTESALQSYFVNLFMPQALYSKDQNMKLQATNFLQAMNVDPTKLAPSMYNDPSFQTQLLSGWIQTQGNQDPRKALNDYSDQFGADAVPAGVQQAAQPSLLQGFENTLFGVTTFLPDLLGAIISPVTGGNKISDFLNQASPAKSQAQNIQQALQQDGVSSQDAGALTPLMNQVAGDTGWMPFDAIDQQWNRAILTVSYFAGDNAYAGKDPKNNNPFDPSSPLGQHIASYQNDLGSGLFGQDWADQHKTEDQIFNFLADSADPVYWLGGDIAEAMRVPSLLRVGTPLARAQSVVGDVAKLAGKTAGVGGVAGATEGAIAGATIAGPIGGLIGTGFGVVAGKVASDQLKSAVSKLVKAAEDTPVGGKLPSILKNAAGKPASAVSTKDVLSDGMQQIMSKALHPKQYTMNAFANAVISVAKREDGGDGLRTLLGIYDAAPGNPLEEKHAASKLALLPDIQKAAASGDTATVLEAIQKDFPLALNGSSALYNATVAMRSLQPNVIDRMSSGVLSRLRTLGAMPNDGGVVNVASAHSSLQHIKTYLNIAGVDDKTIQSISNKWLTGTTEDRTKMIGDQGDVTKALDAAIIKRKGLKNEGDGTAHVQNKEQMIRSGSSFKAPDFVQSILGEVPKVLRPLYLGAKKGEKVVEGSKASTLNVGAQKVFDEWDSMLQQSHDEWAQALTREAARIQKAIPGTSPEDAAQQFLATAMGKNMKAAYDSEVAHVKGMQEALAPTGATEPTPFFTSQMQQQASMPYDPYSLLVSMHEGKVSLASYEKLASKAKADYFTSLWKKFALWQPATQLRIAGGDDLMRLFIDLAQDGHVGVAAKGLTKALFSKEGGFAGVATAAKASLATSKLGKKVLSDETVSRQQEISDTLKQRSLTNPDYISSHNYFNDWNPSIFDTFTNDDENFPPAFANSHRVIANNPEVQAYVKAYLQHTPGGGTTNAIAAAKEFYENDPRGKDRVKTIQGATAESMANALSQEIERIYPSRTMKKWLPLKASGSTSFDSQQFFKLWKNQPQLFSHTVSPRMTPKAQNTLLNRLGTETFSHFMEPFINNARGSISATMRGQMEKNIRATVADDPNWSEDRIKAEAAQQTRAWSKNQLYQGQRSMTGTALRHVFPFYGATANMSKFFMRQFAKHPETTAEWLRLFAVSESSANKSNNYPADSASGLLTALGFSPGDTLGSNLSHMFFFTNDGFASFVPGFGPVFGPVLNGISKNPTLDAMAQSIPGVREQVSQNSGDTYTMFPWLEKAISGIGLMSPLHSALTVPILGGSQTSFQTKLDQKYEQMTADNQAKGLPPPTQDEVATELGKETLTGELVGGALPFESSTIQDATREDKNSVMARFNAATTDTERDQVIAQADPKMQTYLQYEDPRTPQSEEDVVKAQMANMGPGATYEEASAALGDKIKINKDDLAQQNPWILDYATSVYTSGTTSPASSPIEATGPESGTAGFQAQLSAGEIQPMPLQGDNGLQSKLSAAWEIQNGWEAYEQNVVAPQQKILSQLGGDTSSAEYKQFDSQYLQPILQVLKNQYPTWYNNFVSQESTPSDLAGYAEKAAPLNTVTAWETIPHFTADESQRTIMWRKATVLRDQAASGLEELQVGKAPKIEQDQVYTQLQQQLGQLAQEYPQYASELQGAYFNSWKDIVNYETVMEKTYGYNPNAEQGSGQ